MAEIKNIKLNTNNIKQYIHQRCYQVTNTTVLHFHPAILRGRGYTPRVCVTLFNAVYEF